MKTFGCDALVVGSGSAGLRCALALKQWGRKSVFLVTDGMGRGTSRNAGSDKQTYYKLSLAGAGGDSVRAMAEDLFSGGGVNGDNALCEAAGSVRAFMDLAALGVPFPANPYGEYVGYKTDHDPRQRGTSAGPLTSRYMTQALEEAARAAGVTVYDGYRAVRVALEGGRVAGLVCAEEESGDFACFACRHLVLATGGEAGLYRHSVFPPSQSGALGAALNAGAAAANLNQWQYGIASVGHRWNLSGSYQQALPRYVAVDRGGRERELLPPYFDSPAKALDAVFLKGYQWPFDVNKIGGSSLIDLIVYHETQTLGHRVFLDYTREPSGLEDGFGPLSGECRDYLRRCGALVPTPIGRLRRINAPAAEHYREHGIDLARQRVEITVCAQHMNGGLAVDADWRATLPGLYAVGEMAGTFGVYRPGGAALNAGQVGALRAARAIAAAGGEDPAPPRVFPEAWEAAGMAAACRVSGGEDHRALRDRLQRQMSAVAGPVRDLAALSALGEEIEALLADFTARVSAPAHEPAGELLQTWDICRAALDVLAAMTLSGGETGSLGSALVCGPGELPEVLRRRSCPPGGGHRHDIVWTDREGARFMAPRPLPPADDWFETVWAAQQGRPEEGTHETSLQ